MANIFRWAKIGSEWSERELLAYNIKVQRQGATDFFGRELGSIDHLDSNLLSSADPSIAVDFSKETYRFLAYLDLASRPNSGRESAIHDLSKSILEVTGFDECGTVLHTCYNIPLTIRGDLHRTVQMDISLVHFTSLILLVVKEDKTMTNLTNPEPQIIAEAIAAFQHNNKKRAALDLPTLDIMTIPCISMVGTKPTFYLVPVTSQLSNCVISGLYPLHPTVVRRCAPPTRYRTCEGMEVPDYRRSALQYYDAFRDLAKTYWTQFIGEIHRRKLIGFN